MRVSVNLIVNSKWILETFVQIMDEPDRCESYISIFCCFHQTSEIFQHVIRPKQN